MINIVIKIIKDITEKDMSFRNNIKRPFTFKRVKKNSVI